MGSPKRQICDPLTYEQLIIQLSNPDAFCINSPFPFYNKCNVRHPEFKFLTRQEACRVLLNNLDNVASSPWTETWKILKDLAETVSCEKHIKQSEEFAYHWLAEESLPNLLEHMGWKKEPIHWICLGSSKENECPPLDCTKKRDAHSRIHSALNRLAIGGDPVEKVFEGLVKKAFGALVGHWLCDEHKSQSNKFLEELFVKFRHYTPNAGSIIKTRRASSKNTLTSSDTDSESPDTSNSPTRTKKQSPGCYLAGDTVSRESRTRRSEYHASERIEVPKAIDTTSPDRLSVRKRGRSSTSYEHSLLREEIRSSSFSSEAKSRNDASGTDAYPDDQMSGNLATNSSEAHTVSPNGTIPEIKRRRLPSTTSSSGSDGTQQGGKCVPQWKEKNTQEELPAKNTHILNLMAKNSAHCPDDGYIYIFRSPDFPSHVKIGRTTQEIGDRKKQITSKCKNYDLEIVDYDESFRKIDYHTRLEGLIHADLSNERRIFTCTCTRKTVMHVDDVVDKLITHGEWFAIEEDRAKRVVKKWKDWMRFIKPYNLEGKLNAEMLQEIKQWQRDPIRLDNELLHRIYWYNRTAASIRQAIFESRPERLSRWESIGEHWKENFIIVVAHYWISFIICVCLIYWSWIPALAVSFVFPLLTVLYAA